MIVQSGHNFFGSAGNNNNELKEPKSFLAHLRENIETSLYTTGPPTTTRIVASLTADDQVPRHQEEAERISRFFGDKKVSTFYLHMSIAISTLIMLIVIGVSAYACYKRREFQNMDHSQSQTPRRRSSANANARRKSSQYSNERMPINLR